MSAANADHFLIVYLRFETKEKIHLLLPLCYHFFGSTRPVKATGVAGPDGPRCPQAAFAARFCARQFQGRSSAIRLAG